MAPREYTNEDALGALVGSEAAQASGSEVIRTSLAAAAVEPCDEEQQLGTGAGALEADGQVGRPRCVSHV